MNAPVAKAPSTPQTSTNIDLVEQQAQALIQSGTATANDYNNLLQLAAGFAGQHSDTRHNDVLAQIFQGLGSAPAQQNQTTDNVTNGLKLYAAAAKLSEESAGSLGRQMRAAVSKAQSAAAAIA